MSDEEKPQVHVTPDSTGHVKPWRVDCDLCPDDVWRFFTRHWGVLAADEHARSCPNAPGPVPDAGP